MTKVEKILHELIALPSVNPAFLPAGNPRAGEHRVADFLRSTGRAAGLEAQAQKVFPERANLLLHLKPLRRVRARVLLAPHLDTVNGEDDQFLPQRRQGRVYGRGACDTKGSVAAMITALCEVARNGRRPAETEIVFSGLVDEENAQSGSRALAAGGYKADLAIVGEPTKLQVVTAHKGSLWLRLETYGRSAHGATPELGSNAVHTMAKVVDLLQTKYARELARKRHPLLGSATVSVGAIQGGTQPNIVPDQCTIQVDRRTLPGETEARVRGEIRAFLSRHGVKAGCFNDKLTPCEPLETDPELPLVRQLLQAAGQRRPAGVHYFTDASVLAQAGIPSVVFGPGDIAQAHTADEWLAVEALQQATALLTAFLHSLP